MRRPYLLRFPKTQDGIDICNALREAGKRPRGTVPAMLTIAVMAWAGSSRDAPPWTPLKACVKVYCRLDPVSPAVAPIYKMWEKSQSQMPFDAWLTMAAYYGFVAIRKDKLLAPIWEVFTGRGSAPPRVVVGATPTETRVKREAAAKAPDEIPKNSPSASAGVKGLKGMF